MRRSEIGVRVTSVRLGGKSEQPLERGAGELKVASAAISFLVRP